MTLSEMAKRLGLKGSSSLRHAALRNVLKTDWVGGFRVVSEEEYERWIATRPATGRPRKAPEREAGVDNGTSA